MSDDRSAPPVADSRAAYGNDRDVNRYEAASAVDATPAAGPVPHNYGSSTQLDELLTVAEVAALFKVSKSWVYEHTRLRDKSRSERLPHVKLGKYVRFDSRLVRAFLDRQIGR